MAHKGKATSDVSYSVSDGPEAYNNPSFGRRIAEYTEACKKKYGEDYNTGHRIIFKKIEKPSLPTAYAQGSRHRIFRKKNKIPLFADGPVSRPSAKKFSKPLS
jgi:hypothetical protein